MLLFRVTALCYISGDKHEWPYLRSLLLLKIGSKTSEHQVYAAKPRIDICMSSVMRD